jgi:hypothetical protein
MPFHCELETTMYSIIISVEDLDPDTDWITKMKSTDPNSDPDISTKNCNKSIVMGLQTSELGSPP